MTPFQVYLVMQADSICTATTIIAVFGVIASVVTIIGTSAAKCCITKDEEERQYGDWKVWQAWCAARRLSLRVCIPMLLIGTFMPDTKTIATMIVLPKITSPAALNALGTEGKELYGIAREALQGLADRAKPDTKQDKDK